MGDGDHRGTGTLSNYPSGYCRISRQLSNLLQLGRGDGGEEEEGESSFKRRGRDHDDIGWVKHKGRDHLLSDLYAKGS